MAKKNRHTLNFFKNIKEDLSKIKAEFDQTDFDVPVRSCDSAKKILDVCEKLYFELNDLFTKYPDLETVFENDFDRYEKAFAKEGLLDICFIEAFIFANKELCPIVSDIESNLLDTKLLDSASLEISSWIQAREEEHLETQKIVKINFDKEIRFDSLPCHCVQCVGDYRTKLRDTIYQEQVDLIDGEYDSLLNCDDEQDIEDVSNRVFRLRKKTEKNINACRYRLKKGSIYKMDGQIKNYHKDKFAITSSLAIKQVENIKNLYNSLLKEQGLRKDLIGDEEYQRFFGQLGMGIWRPSKILKREFKSLVKAVLALKRKDISANILQKYLGQFWLHSPARRMNRRVIYHMGPTNSGKTYHAVESLCKAERGCYLAPLRLLAAELYDTMNAKGAKTSLLTGEEVIEVEGATHYSSTIEMAKFTEEFDSCVIDEIQMMNDSQRGWAWTRALVGIASKEVHICGDDSALELVEKILKLTGDSLEIKKYERLTELKVEKQSVGLGELERSDALIVFSRKNALKYKADLEDLNFKVSVVYGRLGPEVRREQARKFDVGETDIIVATDAIAMGMNLPIRRIIFSTFSKFFNNKEYVLNNSEIKQISGRAGRYKRFPTGFVNCLKKEEERIDLINKALPVKLDQKELAMVGPDLDIYQQVNTALDQNALPRLTMVEFLRLFNTMTFSKPFYCVDLKEMIEVAEMVENANYEVESLSTSEIFGFTCAPVNMSMMEHVQYFVWILNRYAKELPIPNEEIQHDSDDIDYLETTIKCVELYQWLSRHFKNKYFEFNETQLLANKSLAIEQLNNLLAERIVARCSSCGGTLEPKSKFFICEECFKKRRFTRRGPRNDQSNERSGDGNKSSGDNNQAQRHPRRKTAKSKGGASRGNSSRSRSAKRSKKYSS